jgi:hypothetical protein
MANPRQQFNDISYFIGAAPVEETDKPMTVSTYDVKPIVKIDEIKIDSPSEKVEEDHEFSRKSIQQVVESGQEALQSAIEGAISSGNPEMFAAVSSLMKEITESAAKLLEIQQKTRKIQLDEQKLKGATSKKDETPTTTTNHIYLGSTNDLLKIMENASKRVVSEQ